jgi:hypothetical protein
MAEHERYTMHCRGSISALLQPTGEILIDWLSDKFWLHKVKYVVECIY